MLLISRGALRQTKFVTSYKQLAPKTSQKTTTAAASIHQLCITKSSEKELRQELNGGKYSFVPTRNSHVSFFLRG